jgi:hypothetical protein
MNQIPVQIPVQTRIDRFNPDSWTPYDPGSYNPRYPTTPKQIDLPKLRFMLAMQKNINNQLNDIIKTYGDKEEDEQDEDFEVLLRNARRHNHPKRIQILERAINDKQVEDAAGVGKKKKRKSRKVKKQKKRKTRRGRK